MQIESTIVIDSDPQSVWKVVAEDFDKMSEWSSLVHHSRASDDSPVDSAPIAGRVCEFSPNADGLQANESITLFDAERRILRFDVEPVNAPGALPLKSNDIEIRLDAVDGGATQVTWLSRPDLKLHGKAVSPLLKMGLGRQFDGILKELKHFVETGQPLVQN